MATYPPIEDYGAVGNLETCALVSREGSVDWCPFPHLESPSLFAAVLDAERGGRFRIAPVAEFEASQSYLEGTNVLRTTFETAEGTATVTDFMPVPDETDEPISRLYRTVTVAEGSVDLEVAFAPRFDYARARTDLQVADDGIRATAPDWTPDASGGTAGTVDPGAFLDAPRGVGFEVGGATATAAHSLEAGETQWYVLEYGADGPRPATDPEGALERTVDYWRQWSHECPREADCVFGGPWHDLVVRSGLTLKLLTHHETGTVTAAPTTSLPEVIGGVRNWDYRYNWLRDAAFTVQALANLGHVREAMDYFEWFLDRCHADPDQLQPLYGLHGRTDLAERELDHLSGYRDSAPVRVGNDAATQTQLDVYGELLLAVDETLAAGADLAADDWAAIAGIVDHAGEVWDRPDEGIWEVRCDPKQFVHSKVMCWAALDRGIAIAERGDRDAPLDRWRDRRATIREAVLDRGYDADRGSFRRAFDEDAMDASLLVLPMVGFLPFDDDRVRGTIDAVREELGTEAGLVDRYDGADGLPGEEGAFVLCTCWLVDALALSGEVEAARQVFVDLLDYVSPLGLLAEEVDPATGAQLGNVPQAFSHIGLVNSALYLGHAAGHDGPGPDPMGVRLGEGLGIDAP